MRLRVLALVLLAWSAQSKKKPRKKSRKKKSEAKPEPEPEPSSIKVQIHAADYCLGCLSFVEDYQRAVSEIYRAGAESGRSTPVGPEEIWESMRFFFGDYSKSVQDSGLYLKQSAMNKVQRQAQVEYEAQGDVDEKYEVLVRKRNMCIEDIKACVPDAVETEDVVIRDSCDACVALSVDFEFVSRRAGLDTQAGHREKAWILGALQGACADVGFRHARPALLEETCDDLMDEHENAIVDAVDAYYRRARAFKKQPKPLEELICVDIAGTCVPKSGAREF